MKCPTATLLLAAVGAWGVCGASTTAADEDLAKIDLFRSGDGEYFTYRIPGMVVTARGSILVYCEARTGSGDWTKQDVLLRRSDLSAARADHRRAAAGRRAGRGGCDARAPAPWLPPGPGAGRASAHGRSGRPEPRRTRHSPASRSPAPDGTYIHFQRARRRLKLGPDEFSMDSTRKRTRSVDDELPARNGTMDFEVPASEGR
jgi:hypothetical protein